MNIRPKYWSKWDWFSHNCSLF